MAINFFVEEIPFKLSNKRNLKNWIIGIALCEGKRIGNINYIFASDNYILEINRQYLQHDYFTDIITFNYNEGEIINGDIFISVDTVRVNAEKYKFSFENELYRVIIHGVLHLIGYDDKNEESAKIMRNMEDSSLKKLYNEILF
ncbi:MAG: rRNA maturation RNase YbeY [Bacteroidota bacterium]|nr:rRNA maturation RNase YbeY [Bacteroidota bacterium]